MSEQEYWQQEQEQEAEDLAQESIRQAYGQMVGTVRTGAKSKEHLQETPTLEIVTTEDGPPDVAFDWFPGLHMRYQSKWFRIYTCDLKEPLSKIRQGWIEDWKEKDQIVSWWCE